MTHQSASRDTRRSAARWSVDSKSKDLPSFLEASTRKAWFSANRRASFSATTRSVTSWMVSTTYWTAPSGPWNGSAVTEDQRTSLVLRSTTFTTIGSGVSPRRSLRPGNWLRSTGAPDGSWNASRSSHSAGFASIWSASVYPALFAATSFAYTTRPVASMIVIPSVTPRVRMFRASE